MSKENDMDVFPLSGRTFAVRQSFAIPEHASMPLPPMDGVQPQVGDLRLAATIDPGARSGRRGSECRGSLTASIFDGCCWRRFDLSG